MGDIGDRGDIGDMQVQLISNYNIHRECADYITYFVTLLYEFQLALVLGY